MPEIHASSVVDPACRLADDVVIGPLCVLEGPVTLDAGTQLVAQVHLRGPMTVGRGCTFYPFSSAGLPAQHAGIDHDATNPGVVIGDRNTFRESVTVHASMYTPEKQEPGVDYVPTTIGNGCYFMACSHVGHDCVVEDNVTLANSAVLGGHAHIGRDCFISGNCAVHQRLRIGRGVMMQGGSVTSTNVPPFGTIVDMNVMAGLNLVGMRRSGIDRHDITLAREAFRRAFKSGVPLPEAQEILDELGRQSAVVEEMAEFMRTVDGPIAKGDGSLRSHHMGWLKRLLRQRNTDRDAGRTTANPGGGG